jgi:hypothetical protein
MEKTLCQEHMFLSGVNSFLKEKMKSSLTADLDIWHQIQMETLKSWELWHGMINVMLSDWLQKNWRSVERDYMIDSSWKIGDEESLCWDGVQEPHFQARNFCWKNCVHGTHIYLPDLASCDFFLLHSMKNHLRGFHLDTMEGIWKVILTILNSLQENDFWKWTDSWKQCWNSRIAARGNYFHADHHCSSW